MSYFEDGDCPAYCEELKNRRFLFWLNFAIGCFLTLVLLFAFKLGGSV